MEAQELNKYYNSYEVKGQHFSELASAEEWLLKNCKNQVVSLKKDGKVIADYMISATRLYKRNIPKY